MKIGDTVWRFDQDRRVYRKGEHGGSVGGPIYREHWASTVITGETSRSWLIFGGVGKIPKTGQHPGYAFTIKEVDDACWLNDHRYAIREAVGNLRDAATLRKVAEVIGWKPDGEMNA